MMRFLFYVPEAFDYTEKMQTHQPTLRQVDERLFGWING